MSESPDPIGLSPAKGLQVKREALEELQAGAENKAPNPRFYTDPEVRFFTVTSSGQELTKELAIILNTLGPDKKTWCKSKRKSEEICMNLREAGYPIRTVAAMNVK
jgi:hypothetical protein